MTAQIPVDLFGSDEPDIRESVWQAIGFEHRLQDGQLSAILPRGVIALRADTAEARSKRTAFTKAAGVPPSVVIKYATGGDALLYRVESDEDIDRLKQAAIGGLQVCYPGEAINLPVEDNGGGSIIHVGSLAELSVFPIPDCNGSATPPVMPVTPLSQFSLKGCAAAFEAEASENTALLGDVCLSGQATVWYAPPNAGKTLIALNLLHAAVAEGKVEPSNVYYINADDNMSGLTSKLRPTDELGAHMLAPGHKGFENRQLITLLGTAAERDQAKGVFVIIDTLKKFASLMDKKDSSALADACRRFVMKGGTILGLAHTAKNPNTNGSLRYAGTTDVLEDFDAAYLIAPLERLTEAGERLVEFTSIKRRGNSAETAAFAYAADREISYAERLMSVRPVDLNNLDDFKRLDAQRSDGEMIAYVKAQITGGVMQKIALAAAVAQAAAVSKREAVRVIERYTGTDPEQHHWQMSIKARGAKVFELLPPAEQSEPEAGSQTAHDLRFSVGSPTPAAT